MKQVKCVKGNRVLRPQASGFYFHRKNDDIEGRQLAVETVRRKDNGGSKSEGHLLSCFSLSEFLPWPFWFRLII